MKCECGNNRFFASRMVRQEIITNEYGDFENSAHENIVEDLYAEDEKSFGPYICTKCHKEYENLV